MEKSLQGEGGGVERERVGGKTAQEDIEFLLPPPGAALASLAAGCVQLLPLALKLSKKEREGEVEGGGGARREGINKHMESRNGVKRKESTLILCIYIALANIQCKT